MFRVRVSYSGALKQNEGGIPMKRQNADNKLLNIVVVLLITMATLATAYQEKYLVWGQGFSQALSSIFWPVLAGGIVLLFVMAMSISTRRLLAFIVTIFVIEVINQSLGTELGLWSYSAQGGSYIFGVCIWVVAGLATYFVADKAVVRLTTQSRFRFPRFLNPIIIMVLFSIIWIFGPPAIRSPLDPGINIEQNMFWLFLQS
jgi:hypothetical protein